MAELEFQESPNSKCNDLGKQGFGEIRKRPEAEFGPIGNCGVGFQPWRGIITWRGFASLGPARPNSAPFSIGHDTSAFASVLTLVLASILTLKLILVLANYPWETSASGIRTRFPRVRVQVICNIPFK